MAHAERHIVTADAEQLVDEDAQNLIGELNRRYRKVAFSKVVGVTGSLATAAFVLLAVNGSWLWWVAVVLAGIATIVGAILAHRKDVDRKTVNLTFDLDEEADLRCGELRKSLVRLSECHRLWRVISEADTDDWKRNAGATNLIRRNQVHVMKKAPPFVTSNVDIYSIRLSRQTVYFLPDRLLVYQGGTIGSVPYWSLDIGTGTTRFVEEERVPGDTQIVDRTWRYVNKKGGPDRRFNDNREIPVCRYGVLTFRSSTGLNLLFNTSNADVPAVVEDAIADLRSLTISTESEKAQDAVDDLDEADDVPRQEVIAGSSDPYIRFPCPACGKRCKVRQEHAGRVAQCKCGQKIRVPLRVERVPGLD